MGLVLVADAPYIYVHHSAYSDILRNRRVCLVRSMSYGRGNLESADPGHWAGCARMGTEKRVGAKEWSAGSTTSFWNTLLVYWGEKGESVIWCSQGRLIASNCNKRKFHE